MYKDIRIDSTDLELATELRVSQDLFRRSSKEKREMLGKLQAWAEKNVKIQGRESREMKLQSTTLPQGEVGEEEGVEDYEDSWDGDESLEE